MKSLLLVLLAAVIVHWAMHKPPAQRTATQAKAWADWFSGHRDGGGV